MVSLRDTAVIDGKPERMRDGYLKMTARIARTGVQLYKGYELDRPDMDTVAVYRPASEVFHREALKSLANKPLTLTHPPQMVDSHTYSQVNVGHIGEDIIRDGDHIRVPMMLCDQKAIDAYEKDGVKELSVGYSTDIEWKAGKTQDGTKYDAVQRNIRCNHLAIVPAARGGASLRIGDFYPDQPRDDHGRWTGNSSSFGSGSFMPGASGFGASYAKRGAEIGFAGPPKELAPTLVGGPQSTGKGSGITMGSPDKDEEFRKFVAGLAKKPKYLSSEDLELMTGYRPVTMGLGMDRDFSASQRKEAAKSGAAMPDGSFPIKNTGDLANAVRLVGKAKDPKAAKAHIIARAKALGAESQLPDDWKSSSANDAATSGQHRRAIMAEFKIGGIPVELSDRDAAVVERHMSSLAQRLVDAEKKCASSDDDMKKKDDAFDGLKKQFDALTGEVTVLRKQVEDAKLTPEKLDALVKQRSEIIDRAKALLPTNYVFDGKDEATIRRDAVTAKVGDVAKTLSDDQIVGAFIAAAPAVSSSGVTRLGDGLSAALRSNGPGYIPDGRGMTLADAQAARDAALVARDKAISEAWKGPQKTQ